MPRIARILAHKEQPVNVKCFAQPLRNLTSQLTGALRISSYFAENCKIGSLVFNYGSGFHRRAGTRGGERPAEREGGKWL